MSTHHESAVSGLWQEDFNEEKMNQWAHDLRARLQAPRVSLGLVFMSPHYFAQAAQILEVLRLRAQIPLLIGCSGASLVAGTREIEQERGLVVSLLSLPGAELHGVRFNQEQVQQCEAPAFWPETTQLQPDQINSWLAFVDPFSLDAETWLEQWNKAFPRIPIQGGLASGDQTAQRTQLYLNGDVYEDGGVALALGGQVELIGLISQGCTPIGETWTITKVFDNIIAEIGNRAAYEVLSETFNDLSPEEQGKARGSLHIGLVVNEYLEDFHRGDFLIRNIAGGDPQSGCLAVGALPRMGQTMQFQRRDAAAATEDMNELLNRLPPRLAGRTIYAACLFNCNGRGQNLFGQPDHDARLIQEKIGPLCLSGFFCNGEIGPIGPRNFLHGYTASLALFTSKTPAAVNH